VAATLSSGGIDKHTRGTSADSAPVGTLDDGSAGALQLNSSVTAGGSTDPTPAVSLKLNAGVDTPEFSQGLADRVSFMVENNLSAAKLQVNPPQLGPIEIRIAIQGDHAQVWLTTHSSVTRDALESSTPNLREMLGGQGFGQVSVDISQRSFQDRSAYAPPYDSTPFSSSSLPAATTAAISNPTSRTSTSVLDAYA
jgi:flagellar hook-length control protein FliK